MSNMFRETSAFYQDVSMWNAINVSGSDYFALSSPLETNPAYWPNFGGSPPGPVVCFKEGSKILCLIDDQEKYMFIQDIRQGVLVKTSCNKYKKVTLIGKSKMFNPGNKLFSKNRLYKYSHKNHPEIAEGDDLYITGCHSVLVNKLTPDLREQITELFGKIYITEKKYRLPACLDDSADPFAEEGVYTIWHLALENAVYNENYGIYANGLLVETCSERFLKEFSGMDLIYI
jgi:hypothetical protein